VGEANGRDVCVEEKRGRGGGEAKGD